MPVARDGSESCRMVVDRPIREPGFANHRVPFMPGRWRRLCKL